jgi:hypothetical protein
MWREWGGYRATHGSLTVPMFGERWKMIVGPLGNKTSGSYFEHG